LEDIPQLYNRYLEAKYQKGIYIVFDLYYLGYFIIHQDSVEKSSSSLWNLRDWCIHNVSKKVWWLYFIK